MCKNIESEIKHWIELKWKIIPKFNRVHSSRTIPIKTKKIKSFILSLVQQIYTIVFSVRTGAHHDRNIQYAVFVSWQLDWVILFCQLVHFSRWQLNVVTVTSWWNVLTGRTISTKYRRIIKLRLPFLAKWIHYTFVLHISTQFQPFSSNIKECCWLLQTWQLAHIC